MSDGNDNFIAPLPPEDVYGLGVAGPPSETDQTENAGETSSEENRVNHIDKLKEEAESPPPENTENQNRSIEEHLGNNIDTTA